MTKKLQIAVLAIAGLLALPILASAAHWPNFGGDAGRSGFQPVNMGVLPLKFKFRQAVTGEPRTSPVITDAPGGDVPRVAFGVVRTTTTAGSVPPSFSCEIHIFKLDASGTRVGDANRPNLCPPEAPSSTSPGGAEGAGELNAFGTRPNNSVTPVSSSGDGEFGQLFVIRNETNANAREVGVPGTVPSSNDIAIAQYDERTGDQVADIAVGSKPTPSATDPAGTCDGVTAGLRVESSPVITPRANGSGERAIFFIAERVGSACPGPARSLVKITIPAARTRNALDKPTFSSVPVANANSQASPSIAYLKRPASDAVIPYVVVPGTDDTNPAPTEDGRAIRTYNVESISEEGPSYDPDESQRAQTVSAPVASSGEPPASGAPALYAAFVDGTATTTVVRQLVQDPSNLRKLTGTKIGEVEGTPAPALALSDAADAPSASGQRVVVTTSAGLHVITATSRSTFAGEFSRTTAAVGGDRIYALRDNGGQAVLRLSDAQRVGSTDFTQHSDNGASTFGIGQPALSRRMSAFLSGSPPSSSSDTTLGTARLFVYEASTQPPVAAFSVTPNPVQQGQAVTFDATASKDPDGSIVRYEWDLDGNGDFETDLGKEPKFTTFAAKAGSFNIQLRVTDNEGATDTEAKQLVVTEPPPNQNPTASFAVAPNPAKTGERVSFDARASKDPDGTIAKYEWDLDGNGSFETTTTTPTASRTFAQAGVILAKLKVTDNRGGTAEATQQLVVTRAGRVAARRLTSRVRPRVDTTLPHRFRIRGRLVLPASVTKARGCRGRVTVVVKNGKETISRRTTKLRRTCRYSKRVTFRDAERLEGATSLRFKARFQGNRAVLPRQAKTRRARIK